MKTFTSRLASGGKKKERREEREKNKIRCSCSFSGYLSVLFHYSRANRVLLSLWKFIAIPFSNFARALEAGKASVGELLCMLIDVKMKTCAWL